MRNNYAGVDDPYTYDPVEQFNGHEVEEFVADSLFGSTTTKPLVITKQVAARADSIRRRILPKIEAQNLKVAATQQAVANVIQGRIGIDQNAQAIEQMKGQIGQPSALSSSPMTDAGSQYLSSPVGGAMAETAGNTSAESTASDNGDEPTGRLAQQKTLPNIDIISKHGNVIMLVVVAVLIIFALVYFSKKRK